MSKETKCPICKVKIPQERVEFLLELKYNIDDVYCVNHALNRPVKAIYSGEHGTSELIMCDRVYNDSVKHKFYDSERIEEPDDEPTESEEDIEL